MKQIDKLIEVLRKFPSVGPKQAERFAMYILKAPAGEITNFIKAVEEAKSNVRFCTKCNNYADDELCDICSDERRDKTTICIVESPFDIIAIEKTNSYNGVYYVLNSSVIPYDENNPFFSNIEKLKERIKEEKIKEVIIALNTTTESMASSIYIKRAISSYVEKITRIAFGIPLGSDIDYIDEFTLSYALKARTPITED